MSDISDGDIFNKISVAAKEDNVLERSRAIFVMKF